MIVGLVEMQQMTALLVESNVSVKTDKQAAEPFQENHTNFGNKIPAENITYHDMPVQEWNIN